MSRRLYTILAAGLLTLSGTCRAAEESPPEFPYFEALPVVLSVSRLPQSLADAPGAVTVIDRDTIRATGYRRLPDLLRLVPGFQVAWERGWHGVVDYHGLADEHPNRVLVLIDGRPVNSESFSGAVDWIGQSVDLDDIDRIEVLRGSNSTAYGTNAFLGVINIRTRPASQARGVYLRATQGDQGISDQTLRLGGGFGRLDFRLTLHQNADAGLDRLTDDNRHRFANLRADLQLTDHDEFTLNMGELSGTATEGFGNDPDNPLRIRAICNANQQLRWRHVDSPESEFTLQYFRNRDRYTDPSDITPFITPTALILQALGVNISRSSVKQGVAFQHFLRVSPSVRAVWGLEWRRDSAVSQAYLPTSDPVWSTTQRLFGNVEWRPVRPLSINVGAMAERVSITGTDVSPRLFADLEVAPGHVVRGGVSTATRAPTLFEAFGLPRYDQLAGVGNPDLERERITAYEVGYFGRLPSHGLQADLRIFEEHLDKLIAPIKLPAGDPLVALGYANRYANVDKARIRGASYQVKWSPFSGTQLSLGQAFTYISQRDPRLEKSAPTHSTSLMWTQQLPGSLSFSVMHYALGATDWQGFGDYIPAYRRTDARMSYAFRAGGLRGEVSLVGLNLLDKYYEFRVGQEPETHIFGSRYYGTVRLQF